MIPLDTQDRWQIGLGVAFAHPTAGTGSLGLPDPSSRLLRRRTPVVSVRTVCALGSKFELDVDWPRAHDVSVASDFWDALARKRLTPHELPHSYHVLREGRFRVHAVCGSDPEFVGQRFQEMRCVSEEKLARLCALVVEIRGMLPSEPHPALDLDVLRSDVVVGLGTNRLGEMRRFEKVLPTLLADRQFKRRFPYHR